MVWFLHGVLDLLATHPYLLPIPLGLGWAMIRYNGRVRRRLKARGWSAHERRILAGAMSTLGAAIILVTLGFLIPVFVLVLTGQD